VRQAISFDYRRESKPVEKAVKVAAP
jgi:hypothetical protein